MKHLPQELEVWYLIPALRRELSKALINEFGLSQREVAEKMHLTEAAVSNYKSDKRGNELQFNVKEVAVIKTSAKRIIEEGADANEELFKLTKELKGSDSLCEFHKKHDPSVPRNCDLCEAN